MSTSKYREKVKIVFVIFVATLILSAEPVLAKKASNRSGKSGGGSQKTQQVKKSSPAPKVRRPSNISKTRTRVTAAPRSTKHQARPSTSKPSGQITSRRTVKSSFRQTRSTGSSRRTIRRPNITFNVTKFPQRSLSASTFSGSSFGGGRLTGRSSRIKRSVVISSNKPMGSDTTLGIVESIRVKKPAVTTPEGVTHASKPEATIKEPVNSSKSGRERIGQSIKADKKVRVTTVVKATRDSKPKIYTTRTVENNSNKVLRSSRIIVKRPEKGTKTGQKNYVTREKTGLSSGNRTSFRGRSLFTRPANERSQHIRPANERSQHIKTVNRRVFVRSRPVASRPRKAIAKRDGHRFGRGRSSTVVYRERADVVGHTRRNEHIYFDRHNRIRHRTVRPRSRFAVYYNWGHRFAFRYFYPYYHRKYVFVSLGGYWPVGYRYARYYWYGCHPYWWHGYYPVAHEVGGETYNYYTYNYYNGDTVASQSSPSTSGIGPVDHTTFADVRERLAQEAAEEPDEETLADIYFGDAVKAFEAGHYDIAADMFARAIELAPDDMVLPFAHCQALFASDKYIEAAEVLRSALANVSPEKEGVFYPRGLYPKDDTLSEQIDRLAEKTELYSFDGDLQLLLGYQLLGIGEIDEAVEPLRLAGQDLQNASSAAALLDLLEKIRIQSADDTDK